MTDIETIVQVLLAERAREYGFIYPSDALDRLVRAGEEARHRTAHVETKRTAGIDAMEAELQRIESTLFAP